ncbi:hypothetical protein WMF28_12785 [Sorangium sp. So ce590]|uniref:hypothetical protein n=1 Tax=Sorangium sp. So ce590 TaxID=3133317 RepID=UPI003F5F24D1
MSLLEPRRMRLLFAVGAVSTVGAGGLSGCAYYDDSCYDRRLCLTPPTSLCDGDPTTAPALDECGVFVSEQGNDSSPGTKDAPVKTFQYAVGLAAHGRGHGEAATRRVYACGGSFEEKITLPSGVDLWGGRRCDGGGWSYEGSFGGPDHPTIIAPSGGIPLRVLGVEETALAGDDAESVIFGVRVVAADASAPDGKSSIAMILSTGARAIVQDSMIVAGDGMDGEPGEDAPSVRAKDGEPGNNGVLACTVDAAVGALPVVTMCGDGIESTGGYGGDGGLESGGDGAAGQPVPAENTEGKGLGGTGAGSVRCSVGEDGKDGLDGGRAVGAMGIGQLSMDGWIGVRGEDGKKGGVGQGGGGGGGSKSRGDMMACPAGRPQAGAAGGSGGSGGCSGQGGKGGGYGGASIGIIALQGSALTLERTEVFAGNGGGGGVGGTGQPGGLGWTGGPGGGAIGEIWPACRGGRGGNGGRGGDAGGGLGGPSYGVASIAAFVTFGPDAPATAGRGGDGGLAGNAAPDDPVGMGLQGESMTYRQFEVPDLPPPQ